MIVQLASENVEHGGVNAAGGVVGDGELIGQVEDGLTVLTVAACVLGGTLHDFLGAGKIVVPAYVEVGHIHVGGSVDSLLAPQPVGVGVVVALVEGAEAHVGTVHQGLIVSGSLCVPVGVGLHLVGGKSVGGDAYTVDLREACDHGVKLVQHLGVGLHDEQVEILVGCGGTDDGDLVEGEPDLGAQIDLHAVGLYGVVAYHHLLHGTGAHDLVLGKEVQIVDLLHQPLSHIEVVTVLVVTVGVLVLVGDGEAVVFGLVLGAELTQREIRLCNPGQGEHIALCGNHGTGSGLPCEQVTHVGVGTGGNYFVCLVAVFVNGQTVNRIGAGETCTFIGVKIVPRLASGGIGCFHNAFLLGNGFAFGGYGGLGRGDVLGAVTACQKSQRKHTQRQKQC